MKPASNWTKTPDEWWARLKAREVIKSLKINHPSEVSIENIAWTQGALVVENGLRGCDARLVYTPGVKPAILRVKKSLSPAGKRRFAIAHELGHLKLSHNPGQPTECSEKEFHSWYKDQRGQEVEANIFAAELLMPESLFAPRSQSSVPSFETIESLALDFQTTLTATAIRYVQLCGQRCAIVSSQAGEVSWCWPSPEFHHWIRRGKKLRGNTYAVDFFEKGIATQQMQEIQDVSLGSWIEGESLSDSIREQSRVLFSYDSVLTLLWIDY
jgi:Zn-dependent peptidase ImmA (M78 family)